MAHELCRLLAPSPRLSRKGEQLSDQPIRLFLSHSKRDNKALILATAIKGLIDGTTLARFFDAVDIGPGAISQRDWWNSSEIPLSFASVGFILKSSLVQREVLHAKNTDAQS